MSDILHGEESGVDDILEDGELLLDDLPPLGARLLAVSGVPQGVTDPGGQPALVLVEVTRPEHHVPDGKHADYQTSFFFLKAYQQDIIILIGHMNFGVKIFLQTT